jgi:uncharacterized membrane protein
MNKKLIFAALAGAILQFFLGWLVYGILLVNFMESNTTHYEGLMKDMKGPGFMIGIFLSGLVMSFLVAYIFQRWGKFVTFMKGLSAGAFLGFFLALSYDLYFYSSMNLMTLTGTIVDIITSTIMSAILGGVIAWILGYKSEAAAK